MTRATHRLHPAPAGGVIGVKARYPMNGGGANVSGWLAAVVAAQPALSAAWGCYYQCLPAVGALSKLATWDVSCLHYGGNTTAAAAGIAPLKAAFDAHPARKATWAMASHTSFWAWKKGDDGGDTSGVASALSSRIFPASLLAVAPAGGVGGAGGAGGVGGAGGAGGAGGVGGAAALTATILDGVGKGVNMQIALVLGGAASGFGGGGSGVGGSGCGGSGGGDPRNKHANDTTSVSSHMRAGLWHVIGATGWIPLEPDFMQLAALRKVRAFGDALRRLAPDSGAYMNENDWREPDWQESFFGGGDVYARLLGVKRGVDPKGLLACHHCVGDEGGNWTTT